MEKEIITAHYSSWSNMIGYMYLCHCVDSDGLNIICLLPINQMKLHITVMKVYWWPLYIKSTFGIHYKDEILLTYFVINLDIVLQESILYKIFKTYQLFLALSVLAGLIRNFLEKRKSIREDNRRIRQTFFSEKCRGLHEELDLCHLKDCFVT